MSREEITDGHLRTGWIPVEERLPDEDEEVLASAYNGAIYMVEYDSDFGFNYVDAAAWMPLPEPYKLPLKQEMKGSCGMSREEIIKRLELLFSDSTDGKYPLTEAFGEAVREAIARLKEQR